MTKLYCRHGETFNGDGTTNAIAVSDGGVGASNDLKLIMGGTQSGIVSGDVIHVFTGDNPILNTGNFTWGFDGTEIRFDDGTEFGTAGIFDFQWTNTSPSPSFWTNALLNCNNRFMFTWAADSNLYLRLGDNLQISDILVRDNVAAPHIRARRIAMTSVGTTSTTIVDGVDYEHNGQLDNSAFATFTAGSSGTACRVSRLKLTLNSQLGFTLFNVGNYARMDVEDLVVLGDSANTRFANVTNAGTALYANGVETENGLMTYDSSIVNSNTSIMEVSNITRKGSGDYDFFTVKGVAMLDARSILNFPTLNAVRPNTDSTPYSARIRPLNISTITKNILAEASKLDTIGGVRTLTLNMLLPVEYVGLTKSDFYVDVTYTNEAGDRLFISSVQDDTPLAVSSAPWSSNSYGSNSFSPYEIVIPNVSVSPGSVLSIRLSTRKLPLTGSDFYFVDPDITLV